MSGWQPYIPPQHRPESVYREPVLYNQFVQPQIERGMWAIGQLIVLPNSSAKLSRMLVQAGMRNPTQVMRRAQRILMAHQYSNLLMLATCPIALLVAVNTAWAVDQIAHHNPQFENGRLSMWALALGVSLFWMWLMKVMKGAVMHHYFKRLPNKLYIYVWFWPKTMTSGLSYFRLPRVWTSRLIKPKEKVVTTFVTLMWCLLVKLPLYGGMGFVTYCLVRATMP